MGVVLARVDDRLVHGQVLEGWVPALGVDTIVVVDRRLTADPVQRLVIAGFSHEKLDVRLMKPEEAARFVRPLADHRRVVLIFQDIQGAADALEAGLEFERLNLGNIRSRGDSRRVTPSVYLTGEDVERLSALRGRGVAVEARAVPGERSVDLTPWLSAGEAG